MFRTRLLSGILLVAIALAVFLTGGSLMALVTFMLSVIAYQELTKACKVRGEAMQPSAPVIVGLVMTLVYYGVIGLALARDLKSVFPTMILAVVAAFLAFLFVYVFTFPKYHANQIMAAMFCFLYGPVMLSFLYLLREGFDDGIYLIWFVLLASWERYLRLLRGRADRKAQDDAEAESQKVCRGRGGRRIGSGSFVCPLHLFCD